MAESSDPVSTSAAPVRLLCAGERMCLDMMFLSFTCLIDLRSFQVSELGLKWRTMISDASTAALRLQNSVLPTSFLYLQARLIEMSWSVRME